jgi:hypothetical protein
MCPHKKLKWFETNPDWRHEDVTEVQQIVNLRWKEMYVPTTSTSAPPPTASLVGNGIKKASPLLLNCSDNLNVLSQTKSVWATSFHEASSSTPTYDLDTIETYLSDAQVSKSDVDQAGGVLGYWEQACASRPNLAWMALDFLSAPGERVVMTPFSTCSPCLASSVDAERAFSSGRLQVSHLQHGMSSQTFRAQVAIGSWAGTPLMPGLKGPTEFIKARMRKGVKLDKVKEPVDSIVIDSD